MDSPPKKVMDAQVMATMRDSGHFNHLNASFLSEVAVAVQNSDLDSLKPTRDLRETTNDEIAAELVVSYLTKHLLKSTLQCLNAETGGHCTKDEGIAQTELGLQTSDLLDELVIDWQQSPTELIEANLQTLRNGLERRLAEIGRKSSRHHK
jgi:hypothetical protein